MAVANTHRQGRRPDSRPDRRRGHRSATRRTPRRLLPPSTSPARLRVSRWKHRHSPAPAPVDPNQPEGVPADESHRPPAGFDERGKVRRGTISALWVGLVAAAIVLILLIIFIAQNLDRVTIHFLGFSGSLPVGLVALISAVVGVLIAAVLGTVRILQLRKALKANTPKDQRLP